VVVGGPPYKRLSTEKLACGPICRINNKKIKKEE
jgi:hypothetical protein